MSHKPRTAPLALMGALAFICAPALAAAPSIHIGVSPSLGVVMVDLVGTFQAYYYDKGVSYDVMVTVDTNANLEAAVAGGGGQWNQYDLVLMDDTDVIADLTKNHASYVQGPPFVFAGDRLDLYSASIDVSQVRTGLTPGFTGPVVIANPATDAYGRASAHLLGEVPWSIRALPDARVGLQPDVLTAIAGVDLGMYPYGIVAKSAICRNLSGTETYPEGTYHHEYPPLAGVRYQAIQPTGLAVVQAARTPDQATELTNFVNLLQGVGTTQGTDTLERYCYTLPQR